MASPSREEGRSHRFQPFIVECLAHLETSSLELPRKRFTDHPDELDLVTMQLS
eukprot:CAMPEP_0184750066 /NCGR_PEP_ID=MMETSP0315-20130426/33213_1 /TAXON_ID=101924 /ORGANISM="Rhodosorus marinus, Strain UTEX LB 2760" /LENGTH=52 /DNA_ID=CAMNT_0027227801 /DNA_START=67 /DNA_END=222 /DNA_ORIENTATION=+